MRNFKNNYRRNRYKNHSDRNHHKNGSATKMINDLQNGFDFVRKSPGRNNHNASKLIEKYSSLAREALSNGDKILSENYFQHAVHFTRIFEELKSIKKEIVNSSDTVKDPESQVSLNTDSPKQD